MFNSILKLDRCDVPLGIRDGRVTRAMFTASSMYNHLYSRWSARLQAQDPMVFLRVTITPCQLASTLHRLTVVT